MYETNRGSTWIAFADQDNNETVVEAVVTSFISRKNFFCACGKSWNFRPTDEGGEIICPNCHEIFACVGIGVKVR